MNDPTNDQTNTDKGAGGARKARKPRPRLHGSAQRERVARLVIKGEHDVLGLAETLGFTLTELADWAGRKDHRALLRMLAQLSDTCTQMLINRFRSTIVTKLLALASKDDEKAIETARKACVDLLKVSLHGIGTDEDGAPQPDTNASEAASARGPSEVAILAALEQLGAASESPGATP